jgi:putative phosphoesterase
VYFLLVGVLSDSHDNLKAIDQVTAELLKHGVELVIHLGDIISPFVVKKLAEVFKKLPLIAVKGNNDGDIYQLTTLFNKYGWSFYPEPAIVEVGKRKLLIMHGYGGVENTVRLARALIGSLDVDAVLYGHTHEFTVEKINGKLLLNPGEVCGYLTNKSTYALLDIDSLKAEIHFLGGL